VTQQLNRQSGPTTFPTRSISGQASPATQAAAPKKLLLEGPIDSTLLHLAVSKIMNLLAFVGVIIFDGYFPGHQGAANDRA
jgi:hypothetical protein